MMTSRSMKTEYSLSRTDAHTCIRDLLRCCLPLSQCHGQAYDGAGNMSRYLNGVAAGIQNNVPVALHLLCTAHCTN